ncbi:hypothetical protein ACFU53_03470 [Streptomyces sp. NPDC057474]|uniref:hypothetical protein n=1 Tax=Streptomyces sp. NPDC057474 TaxID=3346144 RepID=UPI0036AD5430
MSSTQGSELCEYVEFGLQCRADIGDRHTAPRAVTCVLSRMRESGVRSLWDWDWDEAQRLEVCNLRVASSATSPA